MNDEMMRSRVHQILQSQILDGGRRGSRRRSRSRGAGEGEALGGRRGSSRRSRSRGSGAALVGGRRRKSSKRGAALVGGRKRKYTKKRGAALVGGRRRRRVRGSALVGGVDPPYNFYEEEKETFKRRPQRIAPGENLDEVALYNKLVKINMEKADEIAKLGTYLDNYRELMAIKSKEIDDKSKKIATTAALSAKAREAADSKAKEYLTNAQKQVDEQTALLNNLFEKSFSYNNPRYANLPYGDIIKLSKSAREGFEPSFFF